MIQRRDFMKKTLFLSTIITVASLTALSSDDYPMLNQEAEDVQIQEGRLEDQRLQDQRLQERRLQEKRLENRRQDQRLQDRRVQERRLQDRRHLVADNSDMQNTSIQTKPATAMQDRFTTTEDRKLASLVRDKIAELTGGPSSPNDIILVIDHGDVKLVGKVSSDDLRTKISHAIQQTKGVKSVHNRLEVAAKRR
jgi:osmotically-inducible protein OsmY